MGIPLINSTPFILSLSELSIYSFINTLFLGPIIVIKLHIPTATPSMHGSAKRISAVNKSIINKNGTVLAATMSGKVCAIKA